MLKLFIVLISVLLIMGCGKGSGGSSGQSSLFDTNSSVSSVELGSGPTSSSDDDFENLAVSGSTPEPSTLALFGIGLGALAARKFLKRKKTR